MCQASSKCSVTHLIFAIIHWGWPNITCTLQWKNWGSERSCHLPAVTQWLKCWSIKCSAHSVFIGKPSACVKCDSDDDKALIFKECITTFSTLLLFVKKTFKSTTTVWANSLTPSGIPMWNKNPSSHKIPRANVFQSLMYNYQQPSKPKFPSVGEWIHKLWSSHMLECYSAIKKDRAVGTDNTADESQMPYVSQRSQIQKTVWTLLLWCRFIRHSGKGTSIGAESRSVASRGWDLLQRDTGEFGGNLSVMMVTQLHIFWAVPSKR